jgi:beta-glucosidase/6-phospho-beta-glucosidase/beta-galactosidase
VACDHYHRWPEDVALMRRISVDAYRFSVAWPRVLPNGTGAVNRAGLAFYDRLVDALLEAGIRPLVTLYHWDLPQALQDRGGWPERRTAEAVAEYAAVVAGALGDRVEDWNTVNEPLCAAWISYLEGRMAPRRAGPHPAGGRRRPRRPSPIHPPSASRRLDPDRHGLGGVPGRPGAARGQRDRGVHAQPHPRDRERSAWSDEPTATGEFDDQERVAYLERHIKACAAATRRGAPVAGYFVWSLLDNFEWSYGYGKWFGLVHVDYGTQRRTLKASGHRYAELIRASRNRASHPATLRARRDDTGT